MLFCEKKLAYSLQCLIDQTPESYLIQSEYLFITLILSTTKSQSRYKRRFYVSFSSSFTTCTFQTIINFKQFQYCNETARQSDAGMLSDHVIFVLKMFLTSKSITYFCRMLYTIFLMSVYYKKINTLLCLTEKEQISLTPVIPTTFELTDMPTSSPNNDAFHFNSKTSLVPTRKYSFQLRSNRKFMETSPRSAAIH